MDEIIITVVVVVEAQRNHLYMMSHLIDIY